MNEKKTTIETEEFGADVLIYWGTVGDRGTGFFNEVAKVEVLAAWNEDGDIHLTEEQESLLFDLAEKEI